MTAHVAPVGERESPLRSLLKALSWRIVATTTTALIAYFITGDITLALSIGGIEFVLKFFIYYAHERAWQLVPRGSIRQMFNKPKS
ncbi:MAG: DUF2061 domain-containing protein [Immundisolibacteraceae bacterium]|nr:DUF2061 domain-containing protein [Immundisolibacteraceae bacterium]